MVAIFEYVKGAVFIVIFIMMLNGLGKTIHKGSMFSENLIYGYVTYTCLQFVGGCIVQLFRLPWLYFKLYMIVVLLIIIIICICNSDIKIKKEQILIHFREYGLLYIIALVFLCLAISNIQYQWNSNNIDDAYYLNKIAMAPYLDNFVDYNYAVGLPYQEGLVRIANTFEIEAAFFAELLGMSAAFYSKFVLSFLNYTLILNAIYWLYSLFKNEVELKMKYSAILLVPILMFGISQEVMNNFHLLYLHDGWQFNTAIWYGSSLVRTLSLIILLIPIIRDGGITKKNIIFEIGIVIALFSKASQIIPVVVVIMLAQIVMYFIKHFKVHKKYVVFTIIFVVILCFIPQNNEIVLRGKLLYEMLFKNGGAIIFLITVGLFVYSFFLSSKLIKTWNIWLLVIGGLLFVPRVNSLFLIFSIYDFVMARTMTLYLFTFVISAIFYGGVALQRIIKKERLIIVGNVLIGLILVYIPIHAINNNLGLLRTVNILLNNKELVPTSTLKLGNELSKLQLESDEPIQMLSPAWVLMDGVPHSLASMVRYQAPNIISISAIPRFSSVDDPKFSAFTQEEQNIFEYYCNGSAFDDIALAKLITTYGINCIVVTSEEVSNRIIEKHGFQFENKEGSYFILTKGL